MALMRLQKFLSEAGVCSRRKGEELIRSGAVTVNGKVVDAQGVKVDPDADRVAVNGKPVVIKEAMVYLALNKPVNVETTCKQKRHGRIVLDLVDIPQRIFPVGRLDKDSEGLLLLTNDGRIHHRLSHPSYEHEKEYVVTVRNRLMDEAVQHMARGMRLEDFETRPCRVRRIDDTSFNIVLKEGKNRQIRKMVEGTGNDVVRLRRVRIANIRLGGLKKGLWRNLTDREVAMLLKQLGLAPK